MKNVPPSLLELSAVLSVVADLKRTAEEMVGSGIVVLFVTTRLFAKQDIQFLLKT